jgi:Protein of unknown function (DUF4019)
LRDKKEEYTTRRLAYLFVVAVIVVPVAALAQNSSKEKAAVASAETWLGLIDKGEYGESWKEAAGHIRNGMNEKKWVQILDEFRVPLGKMIARQLADAACRKSPSGAPDSQYVLMHFYTSFENKKAAMETVIAVLDKDGKWRVASYFLW